MAKYRVILEIDAEDDQSAIETGRRLAEPLADARMVGLELKRDYYWEPVVVEAPNKKS